jgi:hypothetical protein
VAEKRKWFDQTQPQTLQAAVMLTYLNAALAILSLLTAGAGPWLVLLVGGIGANGIANEQRWGYYLDSICAVAYLVLALGFLFVGSFALAGLLNLVFAVILVALLLHPQSREYQRVWFH